MLDVRRMRVLREVAAKGSFSAAADALNFTQSAISQQIAALEREAGTRLVERSARGVRLTVAGEALVRHTDVILARLADAEAELEAIACLPAGHPKAAKARLRLEDLAEEKWMTGTGVHGCPDTSIFLRACAVAGFDP